MLLRRGLNVLLSNYPRESQLPVGVIRKERAARVSDGDYVNDIDFRDLGSRNRSSGVACVHVRQKRHSLCELSGDGVDAAMAGC